MARGLTTVKLKILVAAGSAALVVAAASGVAMATALTTAATHTTAKACVASNGSLRLTQSNGRCPHGTASFTPLAKNGPGTALGYAHILAGGALDASRSYNVKASNINESNAGFYCFKGLSFKPHSAEVTLDYNGLFNGDVPTATVQLPSNDVGGGATCPAGSQVMVFTGLVTPGSNTPGKKLGFFVVFY
jgi:hypothetical protein